MNVTDFLNANKYNQGNPFQEHAQYIKENWCWLKYSYAIAIRVRSRMQELGMTQKQLAQAMGCSQQHISVLLNGRVNMTLETLSKLESALKIDFLGHVLVPFSGTQPSGYLNDPGLNPEEVTGIKSSHLVTGYKPRRKKGPKGANR